MRVLVTSKRDIASQTIKHVLVNEHGFEETNDRFEGSPVFSFGASVILITTERDMIFCDHLEHSFAPDAFIFCSRHRSESGKPALLVHSTGNLGAGAEYGGNPYQLSISAPSLVTAALRRLYEERDRRGLSEFDVSLEVTHHGPTTLETPMVFVELGSDQQHWRDEEGARAVAAAILEAASSPLECEAAIGFGGTHYASKFSKLVLEKGLNIGHMAPKYVLNELNSEMIQQMIQKSAATTSKAVVDWKGTNAENKAHLFPLIESTGLEIVRARDI